MSRHAYTHYTHTLHSACDGTTAVIHTSSSLAVLRGGYKVDIRCTHTTAVVYSAVSVQLYEQLGPRLLYVPSASRQYLAVPHYYEITRARIYCRWTLRACASQVTHSGSPRARTAMLMVMPGRVRVTAQQDRTTKHRAALAFADRSATSSHCLDVFAEPCAPCDA